MLGSSCNVYKKCKICQQTKWYKEFGSKGKGRRKSYCKQCSGKHGLLSLPLSEYKFDIQILKNTDITVRLKLPTNKRIQYKFSYEQAVKMVNEGVAGIVHETLIHKLYDKQTFRKRILQRDKYTCCYCGRYGDTVDHIKPKSNGGISSFNNCICACKRCNKNKDNLSLDEFLYYFEPKVASDKVQYLRKEQQLYQLLQLLETLTNQVFDDRYTYAHINERIFDIIERIESIAAIAKARMFEIRKENHLPQL
ncbi:HNH endonuclease [Virgibacillus salexigens]|uniref:HNH nuclease domain-containing protein n=1 Tax=Virgibacillus kapii TaxID=1638645 RepID=A0ABQ2DN31_9BACI|nr:HNH endonuclease [Virgibacillus kapii]GGJ64415.1 hypothetical protein GCM10007111_27820 [Virgibacillus kapii]